MPNNYEVSKERLKQELKRTEELLELNYELKKFDSFFITPQFLNGRINFLINLQKQNKLTHKKVKDFFIGEFYNLSQTLTTIDGYFKQSKYIKPHICYVEKSLVLCFQKEYTGAINILIPLIEGCITKYLEDKSGKTTNHNRYKKIRLFFSTIKIELMEKYCNGIKNSSYYNIQQKEYLIKLQRKCLENWTELINFFIQDILFANSNENKVNVLNRHKILHSLEINNYDNLENYIKLFNALSFINWFFYQIEDILFVGKVDKNAFLNKRLYYEKLIHLSEKSSIYKDLILDYHNTNSGGELNKSVKFRSLYEDMSFKSKIITKIKIKCDYLIRKSNIKIVNHK